MRRPRGYSAATALALILSASPAWAQEIVRADSGAPAGTSPAAPETAEAPDYTDMRLKEVTVTARRREENLQEVPVAVTALSNEDILTNDLRTATDLQHIVPSLNVTASLGRSSESFTLRGQRQTGEFAGAGAGASVVAYFAEVPSNGNGPGNFFDLANVQVLKGPQGTLFGRNTTGGAILFEPQTPTNQFEGYVSTTIGEYNRRDVEGVVNVPIVKDKVLFRIGAQSQKRDGFTRDVNTGADYDNRDNWTARASLTLKPADFLENTSILQIGEYDENGAGIVLLDINPASPFAPYMTPLLAAQQANGIRQVGLSAKSKDKGRTEIFVNKTALDLSPSLQLTNIASYSKVQRDSGRDEDGTILPIQDSNGAVGNTWSEDAYQASEEIRLSSGEDTDLLTWQAGAYFDIYRRNGPQTYSQNLAASYTSYQTDADQRRDSRALFGQVSVNMGQVSPALEGLSLTGGYRYTWDKFHLGASILGYPGVIVDLPPPSAGDPCVLPPGAAYPNCDFGATGKSEGASWLLGADYKISPDMMAYVSFRRGYKSGGFNPVVAIAGGLNDPNFSFDPERVDAAEIGLKTSWQAAALQGTTNVAVFHTGYDDIQVLNNVLIGPVTTTAVQNAAKGTIQGFELEGDIRAGEYVTFNYGYSYLHAKYDEYMTPPPVVQDLSALPFLYTPESQYNIGMTVDIPVSEQVGDVRFNASYAWQDDVFAGFTSLTAPYSNIPAYGLLNMRLDWERVMGFDNLDASLFVNNLTDEEYRVGNIQQYTGNGYVSTFYGAPRMVSGSLRVTF
nr:TonB-dependent receptor [uncultured Hyphomonas sp.]